MRGREGAQAQQRRGYGNLQPLGQRANLVHGIGFHNAVASQDDRPLGRQDQLDGFADGILLGREHGVRAVRSRCGGGKIEIRQPLLRVLGDVHQHRPGTSGARHQEGLAQHRGDVLRAGDDVVVLGDRQGNAGDIDFLEGVCTQQLRGDLPGDADQRHRVHHGRGDAGDQVGGRRAGGGNGDADLARGARVAVGRMRGALFVAHQNMADRVLAQSVVDRQDRSTGIAEYFANALAFEGGPDDLSAGEARGLAGGGCRLIAHYQFLLK